MRPALRFALLAAFTALLPTAAASGHFGEGCSDPTGDAGEGNTWIDITGIRTRLEDGVVTVRVAFASPPGAYMATHSLAIDFEGDGNPDLSYLDNGGGSFRGSPVYWSTYPVAEDDEVVYPLKGEGVDAAALEGPKWTVTAGAFTARGSDTSSCAGGGSAVPGPAALALVAAAVVLARLTRR